MEIGNGTRRSPGPLRRILESRWFLWPVVALLWSMAAALLSFLIYMLGVIGNIGA